MSLTRLADVEKKILSIRSHRVMLDSDLAVLYGVETKALNKAVRRNLDRFPDDFMFVLTPDELKALRFQIGTSKGRGGARYKPHVFTEQGVAMLSGVLKSKRAVQVNVEIMRAFVRLRRWAMTYQELTRRLDAVEKRYDGHFKLVFQTMRQLLKDDTKPARRIGFK